MNTTTQQINEDDDVDIILLDIHIPLTRNKNNCASKAARTFNIFLRNHVDPSVSVTSQEIDFPKLHVPHVTLYQTKFYKSAVNDMKIALQNIADEFLPSCGDSDDVVHVRRRTVGISIELTGKIVREDYAMLDIDMAQHNNNNNNLQRLSDIVVNTMLPYVVFPAEVPQWVHHIPDAKQRARKMELVRLYGSPNVMEEFHPHVTVGYNEVDPVGQKDLFLEGSLDLDLVDGSCSGMFDTIAIGNVGIGGSVLHGPVYEAKLVSSEAATSDVK